MTLNIFVGGFAAAVYIGGLVLEILLIVDYGYYCNARNTSPHNACNDVLFCCRYYGINPGCTQSFTTPCTYGNLPGSLQYRLATSRPDLIWTNTTVVTDQVPLRPTLVFSNCLGFSSACIVVELFIVIRLMHKINSVKRAKAISYTTVVTVNDPAEGIVDGLIPTARDDDVFDHDYDIFGSPPLYEDNVLINADMDESEIAKAENKKMAILARGSSSSSSGEEGSKKREGEEEEEEEEEEDRFVSSRTPTTRIGRFFGWVRKTPGVTKNKCCRFCFVSFSRTRRFFEIVFRRSVNHVKTFVVAIFYDPLPASTSLNEDSEEEEEEEEENRIGSNQSSNRKTRPKVPKSILRKGRIYSPAFEGEDSDFVSPVPVVRKSQKEIKKYPVPRPTATTRRSSSPSDLGSGSSLKNRSATPTTPTKSLLGAGPRVGSSLLGGRSSLLGKSKGTKKL